MLKILFYQSLIICCYATIWFLFALRQGKNDVADIAWGGGFICAALTAYLVQGAAGSRPILVFALVTIWGVRLMVHIGWRNRGKPEDHRYQAWREQWGQSFVIRTFFQIFLLQGFLSLLILLPVTRTLIQNSPPLTILDAVGFSVWFLGFFFETVGDFQLLQFKKNASNKGKIITTGLWAYTRHPNYFGEVTLWWGIYLLCLSVPGNGWTIIGPLTITYLILKVSGTPMLEKRYADHPEYARYIQNTSAFFPFPPKK